MIEKLQAVNTYVLIIRDEEVDEIGGLIIPDQARVKPATGIIISVGEEVSDKRIEIGKKALFNKNVGVDITLGEETVTVLHGGKENSQIIAIL